MRFQLGNQARGMTAVTLGPLKHSLCLQTTIFPFFNKNKADCMHILWRHSDGWTALRRHDECFQEKQWTIQEIWGCGDLHLSLHVYGFQSR